MEKNCKQCQRVYQQLPGPGVEGETIIFDPPLYCDECSNQRRLSWLNHYSLYNRPCDHCGDATIGMYKVNAPYQVYCAKCWQGRDIVNINYDGNNSFLKQFQQLLATQPLPALWNDNNLLSSNCAYTNNLLSSKNCYFVFDGNEDQDCYYSYALGESKDCSDCSYTLGSELSYELVNCHGCYHSAYLLDSRLANNCYFGYDLSNCSDCLFSSGLRNKQYYIFNKSYSKEDYEQYVNTQLNTGSYQSWQKQLKQYQAWLATVVRKESTNRKSENCIGNDILYSKNVTGFFMYQCEDCHNILNATTSKNCNNCFQVGYTELSSEFIALENSYTTFASAYCQYIRDSFYSLYCKNCTNIFGCIGLQNQSYCIFNKKYSPQDYNKIVSEIISKMRTEETFGQFFPPSLSPFSCDETLAQDIFPLSKAEALQSGYNWQDPSPISAELPAAIPDHIKNVTIAITKTPLTCESCAKQYRITEQELNLYQNIKVPIPHQCFRCRHKARTLRRPNFRLYERTCNYCQKEIITHYPLATANQVYCHDCYEKEVIIN